MVTKRTELEEDVDLLNTEEAANYLNLKPSRIKYEVRRGSIPFLKVGRSVRFDRASLNSWIRSFAQQPKITLRQAAKQRTATRRAIIGSSK